MPERLDIVLFGATGFTGKHCIPMIAKFSKEKNRALTWGVAGRSESKLRAVLDLYGEEIGNSLKNIPIIIADVQDEESLFSMVRQARVIINCCGPFHSLGEAVVKACIQEGTHHIDVSGEIQYMEKMQLKYNQEAEEKGVYIISACGYGCIPIDLGVVLMQEKFTGTLNSVEAYLSYWEEGTAEGAAINYGTWESSLHVLTHAKELKSIRRQLFARQLPNFKPNLEIKLLSHKSDLIEGWAVPYHAVERPVVTRTQRLLYEKKSKRPVQLETYLTTKSFLHLIALAIAGLILLTLTKFSAGVNLLLKYPEMFTFGFISRQPPSEERIKNSQFLMTLCGKGWNEKSESPDHQFSDPPDRMITATIQGSNPVYGVTCLCLVLPAIVILTERDKMPSEGGVLPPGYAFGQTSLLQQLNENGLKYRVLYEKESQ